MENEPTKYQKFYKNMMWMLNSGEEAEAMTTPELIESLCELDHNHVSSLESAIFGEVVFRLNHPNTWRIIRAWNRIVAKYQAWKYCRKKD